MGKTRGKNGDSSGNGARPPPKLLPIVSLQPLDNPEVEDDVPESGDLADSVAIEELNVQAIPAMMIDESHPSEEGQEGEEPSPPNLDEGAGTSPPSLENCVDEDDSEDKLKDEENGSEISSVNEEVPEPEPRVTRRKSGAASDPKKIIQTIFAKPKKEKPKKRKGGKTKGKRGKGGLGKNTNAPKSSSDCDPETPKDSNEIVAIINEEDIKMEVDEDDDAFEKEREECAEMEENVSDEEMEVNRRRTLRPRGMGNNESSEDQQGNGNGNDNRKIKEEQEEPSSSKSKENNSINNNEDAESKKSDDEDDDNQWKPLRAAMVAAMELVAKKQVTEDMRNDRRVRKQMVKQMPPKGRGRRAIYKRLNKPIKSCPDSAIPVVRDSLYFDHTFFMKGDIVSLLRNLEARSRFPMNLATHDFFQVNGFLQIPLREDCASLSLLTRIAPVPERPPRQYTAHPIPPDPELTEQEEYEMFFPCFKVDDYILASSEEMIVGISELKFVMRCPPDLYFGHDLTYEKREGGRIYTRLGKDFIKYDEQKRSKPNEMTTEGLEDNSSSITTISSEAEFSNHACNSNSNSNSGESTDGESIENSQQQQIGEQDYEDVKPDINDLVLDMGTCLSELPGSDDGEGGPDLSISNSSSSSESHSESSNLTSSMPT